MLARSGMGFGERPRARGLLQRGEQALQQRPDLGFRRDAAHEHGELVAAQARHGVVAARDRLQPLAEHPQQLIARGVALRVVDLLEAVEVEADDRQRLLVLRARQQRLQQLAELRAVHEARERIVVRQPAQAAVGELLVRDVGGDAAPARERAAAIHERPRAERPPRLVGAHGRASAGRRGTGRAVRSGP
jgi:hypothetical protein